jgi:hypothetical protein
MPAQSKISSEPIVISSDSSSSGTISISSSSPIPAQKSKAAPWPSGTAGRRVSDSAGLSARMSRPYVSSRRDPRMDLELELEQLRDLCETLQTDNSELQGRVDALT